MAPVLHADDALLQAGTLAFAMIRFEEGAAHPLRGSTPPGTPRLREDVYAFAPSWHLVPRAEVPRFLAGLPSPAMLFSTTSRGFVALLLLGELAGERAAGARAEFANQQAGLANLAGQLGLQTESRILLEFDDEEHVVSLAVLRLWSERFIVNVGWNLGPLEDDPRATARLNLFRSDGMDSSGDPAERGFLRITDDVPIAYHTDADMVLAALRRHVPTVLDRPMDAKVVHVWLVLDESGRMERTAISLEPLTGSRRTFGTVLLEPFPGESLSRFESAGSIHIPAGYAGPNTIGVLWLQRRADAKPDAESGVYQFDAQRLLPPRSTLEALVKERYPMYARVGLTEWAGVPVREGEPSPEPNLDEAIVPWFIVDAGGSVLETWLGPVLQSPIKARQMIEERHPSLRFSSVRIGVIHAENGSRPPIVWATLNASSPRPEQ